MAPIKVGIIGLSKKGWAAGAHFPYLKASDNYEIVAICNSSLQSSQEAIKLYELPTSTKAYADPEGAAPASQVLSLITWTALTCKTHRACPGLERQFSSLLCPRRQAFRNHIP